ncbi:hypothetical protein ABTL04_20485, partial [Acinetobacter baumannii]
YSNDIVVPRTGISLADGTTFPAGAVLNYDVPLKQLVLPANYVLPVRVTLRANVTLPAGTVLQAAVRDSTGKVLYAAGTALRQDAV